MAIIKGFQMKNVKNTLGREGVRLYCLTVS